VLERRGKAETIFVLEFNPMAATVEIKAGDTNPLDWSNAPWVMESPKRKNLS